MTTPPDPLERCALRARVQVEVDAQIAHQRAVLAPVGPDLALLVDAVARLLAGGKRLRAGFLYWGYRLAGGADSDALVRMATTMELFQAAALLHDDVMDGSDTRRGMPAAHRSFGSLHREAGWSGPSDRFGEAAAILAGDLCLQWSDELFATSGLPAEELRRARPAFDLMRTQLMGGQYLDLLESARGWEGLDLDARLASVRQVIRYKSAKYTIEHPLLIGAHAAGLDAASAAGLSRYGLALGEAFQLRDDLLGVFGDPARTGKPAGDDLREGKRTMLIAHALDRADTDQAAIVEKLLGRPDLDAAGVHDLREVLVGTGAVEAVEETITTLAGEASDAVRALRGGRALDGEALDVLDELVLVCTARET